MKLVVGAGVTSTEMGNLFENFKTDILSTLSSKLDFLPARHCLPKFHNARLEVSVGLDLCNFWREGRAFTSINVQC